MARKHELVFALNAGGIDPEALSRIDLEKMRLAGEHPVSNWLPRVVGPCMLRPGMEHMASVGAVSRLVEFVRDSATAALLSLSDQTLRIFNGDGTPVSVVASASAIVNPTFTSGGGGWTNVSDVGAGTGGAAVLGGGGGLTLTATRYRAAAIEQAVSIAGGDQAKPHTLAIDVTRGPVFFRIGSVSGAENIITEARLMTGSHKLTFTPGTGTIYIRFRSEDPVVRTLTRCTFEHTVLGGAGPLTLPTPWNEADLPFLSWDQSADVVFIADGQSQQRRIERRGASSWSIVLYQTRNGPLQLSATDKISLTASSYSGNGNLTSSLAYFKPSHVGALFELTHNEQHVIDEFYELDQKSNFLTVRGLFSSTVNFDDRNFGYNLDFATGSFVGEITLERSTDADGAIWSKVKSFTAGAVATYNDEQSNLLANYRLRCTAYTSGFAVVALTYLAGTATGLVRVTEYNNAASVNYETISPLGGVGPSRVWRGPQWSDDLGWPRVPRFFDGRLWWFRGDKAFGSIVDDYDNYDDTMEGDSGPVIRSVGSGPAEGARWALDMQRLIAGTSGFEASIRSSSFDEPITPTAFTVRNASTLGVSFVPAVKIDRGAIFVQRSGRRLYEMLYASEAGDYSSSDISRLNPGAFAVGIKDIAVQRQPDTRVYIVLDDGGCVVLTYEREDKVVAFTTLETDGDILDVAVLPGVTQDQVYFLVDRGGIRLERMAQEEAQRSVSTCSLFDAFKDISGTIVSIETGQHLAGRTVQVWADGQRRPDVTLNGSGSAPLGATYGRVVYGLAYKAKFKSAKLAYAANLGAAVGQTKIIRQAALVLSNSCLDGIRIGMDEDNCGPIPDFALGAARTKNQFFAHYDHNLFAIYSDWNADSRIYFEADSAEGPVTVQSLVLDVETKDGYVPASSR